MALGADQCIKVKTIIPEPPMQWTCSPTPPLYPALSYLFFFSMCWFFTDLFATKQEGFLIIFLTDDFELKAFISKKTHWFQSFEIYQTGLLNYCFGSVNKDSICI